MLYFSYVFNLFFVSFVFLSLSYHILVVKESTEAATYTPLKAWEREREREKERELVIEREKEL